MQILEQADGSLLPYEDANISPDFTAVNQKESVDLKQDLDTQTDGGEVNVGDVKAFYLNTDSVDGRNLYVNIKSPELQTLKQLDAAQ